MAGKTANSVAEKWNRNIKHATTDMKEGAERVTESPGKAASAKLDKMRAAFNEAMDSGKVERGLNRFTVEEWKDAYVNTGLARVAGGADKAMKKTTSFFEELLPHVEAGKGKLKGMADVTPEDSKNKMIAWFDHMRTFKRKG